MSMKAAINGFTAWTNMRLSRGECAAESVLQDVMEGERLKLLLQSITGTAPKRLESLNGLTAAQKVIRVDWFIDALKTSGKLPRSLKVDSKMFSMQSADHIFPVLWHLVSTDIHSAWEVAPLFQRHSETHIIIAEPLKIGPCDIANATDIPKPFYVTSTGKSAAQPFKRKRHQYVDPTSSLIEMVNKQLKMTPDGRKLHIEDLDDLIDSRVLCALVNSLVPGTFTTEVLLNDRWTINLALQVASEIFRVKSLVDSGDLFENDEMGTCAFMAYFLTSGYQFSQAQAVIRKMEELKQTKEDLLYKLKGFEEEAVSTPASQVKQKKQVELKLSKLMEEIAWVSNTYNCDNCASWLEHAKQVQAQVREKLARKMKERFDIITVPRPMTINRFTEGLVINLSLTGGNGFYQGESKETLWTGRKLVIRDRETGEFHDDFTGVQKEKGSVREMLELHPYEVTEVNPTKYTKYELFFESTSRNKTMKGGTQFLYQVFPGTTSQCQRLLRRAAKIGELSTVEKLVLFFRDRKDFINCKDPETGNTALHLASRHGHFDTVLHLLENGAHVNVQNSPGCTPFFLSTEGLHKQLSQLLLEWGADIHIKNKISKTALELTRNADLKDFLAKKYEEYQELSSRVWNGDVHCLEGHLKSHVSHEHPMASLKSRCVRGHTLFHMATALGSTAAVKLLLAEHVDANIRNVNGATPLHMTRDPSIVQTLLEHGGDLDVIDGCGNTPLHLMCADKRKADTIPDCITLMVRSGASLDTENDDCLLPVHSAASQGLTVVIETLLACSEGGSLRERLIGSEEGGPPSLIYLALMNNHLNCAQWLAGQGFPMKTGEADRLALRILKGPPVGCNQPVETFQFLVQHGADVNAVYTKGNRPLHLSSALVRVPEITDLLLDSGADTNAKNSTQATPLFVACQTNNPYVASRLLAKGADYQVTDVSGRCAFDYVSDYEEWIDSGYFSEDIRARLRAFSLKHAKDLVKSISRIVKLPKH